MAAIALQGANLVWEKVKVALQGASPNAQLEFKQLKLWLSTQKNVRSLQFIGFAAEDIVTNTGFAGIVGGGSTVYGAYFKARRTSGTTASFQAIHDAADNSATTTTVVTAKINAAGQEHVYVSPSGIALATDLTISAATAVGGATESAAADASDGFVLIGA